MVGGRGIGIPKLIQCEIGLHQSSSGSVGNLAGRVNSKYNAQMAQPNEATNIGIGISIQVEIYIDTSLQSRIQAAGIEDAGGIERPLHPPGNRRQGGHLRRHDVDRVAQTIRRPQQHPDPA